MRFGFIALLVVSEVVLMCQTVLYYINTWVSCKKEAGTLCYSGCTFGVCEL